MPDLAHSTRKYARKLKRYDEHAVMTSPESTLSLWLRERFCYGAQADGGRC